MKSKLLVAIAILVACSGGVLAASVDLHVKEWYPRNNHYIFVCGDDFGATSFDWRYGDGQKLLDVAQRDTYHVFEQTGTYMVECAARTDAESATDTLTVTVGSIRTTTQPPIDPTPDSELDLGVKQWYPQGNDYIFVCGDGNADFYDFIYGDGQRNMGYAGHESFHRYSAPGTYTAECNAHKGENVQSDTLTVTVTGQDITGVEELQSACLLSAPVTTSSGWIEYDRTVGEQRQLVWIQDYRMIHWITATSDGNITLTRSWGDPGEFEATFPDASICFDGTCVTPKDTTAKVNSTCIPPGESSLSIRLYPGFPEDHKVVLECVASGFTPDGYSWDFGDGSTKTTLDYDAYHAYAAAGTYEASCSAEHNGQTFSAAMNVTVNPPFDPSFIRGEQQSINSTLSVGATVEPQWGTYLELVKQEDDLFTLHCGEIGHNADTPGAWDTLPSGLELVNESADGETRVVRALAPGSYTVHCSQAVRGTIYWHRMWDPSSHVSDPIYHNALLAYGFGELRGITGYGVSLGITYAPENPDANVEISFAPLFPVDNNAAFECSAEGFVPTNYTFDFGDGTVETRPVFDIYHTYSANGTYTVSCTATDGVNTATDSFEVEITSPFYADHRPHLRGAVTATQIDGRTYELSCTPVGFRQETIDWAIICKLNNENPWNPSIAVETCGGSSYTGLSTYSDVNHSIVHTLPGEADYQATCAAYVTDGRYHPDYYDYTSERYHNVPCSDAAACQSGGGTVEFSVPAYTDEPVGDDCSNLTGVEYVCSATGERCHFTSVHPNGWTVGYWSENGGEKSRVCTDGYWFPADDLS